MAGLSRHIFFLFALAAVCYGIAVYLSEGQLAFVIFISVGLVAELVFWALFWRQRRAYWSSIRSRRH
jgi:hypothetical protein